MPEHRPGPDAPGRAALATIERIKQAIVSHPDPETLNEIRAAFRREIPLHLRSYAAALLILEAAPASGRDGRKNGKKPEGRKTEGRQGRESPKGEKTRKEPGKPAPRPDAPPQEPRLDENRPRYMGEGTTIFLGMGKRQRLYPRVLYRILTEDAHLAPEEIGDIRSFDNYSFADIDPLCAEALITSLDGYAFRGRGLPVSKARKRGASGEEEGSPLASEGAEDVLPVDEPLDDEAGLGDDFTDEYEGVDESFGAEDDEVH